MNSHTNSHTNWYAFFVEGIIFSQETLINAFPQYYQKLFIKKKATIRIVAFSNVSDPEFCTLKSPKDPTFFKRVLNSYKN